MRHHDPFENFDRDFARMEKLTKRTFGVAAVAGVGAGELHARSATADRSVLGTHHRVTTEEIDALHERMREV